MADREQSLPQFIRRRRSINQHKDLRQDARYRQIRERAIIERKRILEDEEAKREIKEYNED